MKKTILVFVLTLALALSFAGCGKSGTADVTAPAGTGDPAAQQQAPEAAAAEEDGQNPVMNVVGVYSNDYSVEALVEAEGMENAKITVTYAGSPWFQNRTVMSGPFDPETLTVTFNNATLGQHPDRHRGLPLRQHGFRVQVGTIPGHENRDRPGPLRPRHRHGQVPA